MDREKVRMLKFCRIPTAHLEARTQCLCREWWGESPCIFTPQSKDAVAGSGSNDFKICPLKPTRPPIIEVTHPQTIGKVPQGVLPFLGWQVEPPGTSHGPQSISQCIVSPQPWDSTYPCFSGLAHFIRSPCHLVWPPGLWSELN